MRVLKKFARHSDELCSKLLKEKKNSPARVAVYTHPWRRPKWPPSRRACDPRVKATWKSDCVRLNYCWEKSISCRYAENLFRQLNDCRSPSKCKSLKTIWFPGREKMSVFFHLLADGFSTFFRQSFVSLKLTFISFLLQIKATIECFSLLL
jgi:hypothetical protein